MNQLIKLNIYSIHRKSSVQLLNIILKNNYSAITSGCNINNCTYNNNINNNNNILLVNKKRNDTQILSCRNFSFSETITNLWTTMSNSTPVAYFQHGIINFHDATGLPWWGTIVLSTILLRSIVTLPLTIYQNKIMARLELISLEMPQLIQEIKKEAAWGKKKFKWSEEQTKQIYARSIKKQYQNLIIRDNCHPFKCVLVVWTQIPLWIIQSVTVRNLIMMLPNPNLYQAKLIYVEMTIGGFGWISNLAEVDSTLILPITLGILNLTIIEIQNMIRKESPRKLQKYITNFFRGISLMMIFVGANVPSCLCLYWTTSSAYGLSQNLLLISPNVKRFVGIPITPSEIRNPYKHLANKIQSRLINVKQKLS